MVLLRGRKRRVLVPMRIELEAQDDGFLARAPLATWLWNRPWSFYGACVVALAALFCVVHTYRQATVQKKRM